jgi:hypothetical protein
MRTHVGDFLNRVRTDTGPCPFLGYDGIDGCAALRDPFCYLERGSQRQPQVDTPFVCPVYNRAMEILGEPLRERCVDPYDITPQRQTWQRWDAWK